MKYFILILILIISFKTSFAQSTDKAELSKLLSTAREDTNKVNILNQLSDTINDDVKLKYASLAFHLAKKLNFKKGIINAANQLAGYYDDHGQFIKAKEYYQKSMKLSEELGDKRAVAFTLRNLGYVNYDYGYQEPSEELYLKSAAAFEKLGDKNQEAISYQKLGNVFGLWSKPQKVLKYYQKCLSIREEIHDTNGIIECYIDLGYLHLSYFDISEAFNFGQKSLALSKELGNVKKIRESIGLIKSVYKERHSGYTDVLFVNNKIGFITGNAGTGYESLFLQTIDEGATWTLHRLKNNSIRRFYFIDKNHGSGIGLGTNDYGDILNTSDGGLTWKQDKCLPEEKVLYDICFPTPEIGYAVGTDGVILKKDKHIQTNWFELFSVTGERLDAVSFSDSLHGVAAGGNSNTGYGIIIQTGDGGATWNIVKNCSQFIEGIALKGIHGIAVGYTGVIYITDDGGVSWVSKASGTTENLNSIFMLDEKNATAVGWSGTIIHTDDGGETWTKQVSGTTISLGAVCFTDANHGIAVGDKRTILRTTNGGTTWKSLTVECKFNMPELEQYESYLDIQDSITKEANRKAELKLQLQFEYEKKEAALKANQEKKDALAKEEKARQKIILGSIGGGVAIISASALLLFFSYRRKQKAEMQYKITESRLHAINAQMNPHFIFNCMHSVQTLINKKDFQGADNCLVRFAKLIRKVLDNSTQKEILLEDEIETLRDYVELEKLHLEYPMEFEVCLDEKLNQVEVYVPPLIIQPFVENAIIHGLKPKKANGKIFVNIKKEIDTLVIEIADNGVGRKNNNIPELTDANGKKRKSYGEPLTKERLENIGRQGKLKAGFIIDDVYDAENRKAGTKVTLTIPL